MISVIICTRNRPIQVNLCLKSILNSKYYNYELVVVDQSENLITKNSLKKIRNNKIKYFHQDSKGLTKARNLGIKKANGSLLVFTDDDCIVSRNWLTKIYKIFQYKHIEIVFGQTLPYKPFLHKNQYCPAITIIQKRQVLKNNQLPISGYIKGNNMIYRKKVFNKIGFFKEWLGPGSESINGGEETDMVYRSLISKINIFLEPSIIIYHNRWLTAKENDLLIINKHIGNIAIYIFYFIKYRRFEMLNYFCKIIFFYKNRFEVNFLNQKHYSIKDNFYLGIKSVFNLLKGILIGFKYSIID